MPVKLVCDHHGLDTPKKKISKTCKLRLNFYVVSGWEKEAD